MKDEEKKDNKIKKLKPSEYILIATLYIVIVVLIILLVLSIKNGGTSTASIIR